MMFRWGFTLALIVGSSNALTPQQVAMERAKAKRQHHGAGADKRVVEMSGNGQLHGVASDVEMETTDREAKRRDAHKEVQMSGSDQSKADKKARFQSEEEEDVHAAGLNEPDMASMLIRKSLEGKGDHVPGWTDSANDACSWYNEETRCLSSADWYEHNGLSAKKACKNCCMDDRPGGSEWVDNANNNCAWYNSKERCDEHGSHNHANGYSATTACCACGGGTVGFWLEADAALLQMDAKGGEHAEYDRIKQRLRSNLTQQEADKVRAQLAELRLKMRKGTAK